MNLALRGALGRAVRDRPADLVTLVRAVLTGVIAVLAMVIAVRHRSSRVASDHPPGIAFRPVHGIGSPPVRRATEDGAAGTHPGRTARSHPSRVARAIVPLATVALVLDAVDGQVARRTGTASAFGARFDGETDAALILVLSLHAARGYGAWVAAAGLARYAFAAAGIALPWMRRTLPFRHWRKVATAGEGIALVAAAASFVPRPAGRTALLVGLALIAESFGRDVVWLWRRRREPL